MAKVKVSMVNLTCKSAGYKKTFIVKHMDEVDPVGVFISLIDQAPEMKKAADEQAKKIYHGLLATYPKRLADWEESKRLCEEYQFALKDYDQKLVELDERKMSGQIEDVEDLGLPERPSPEHYPLPPKPEDPEPPLDLPFDGSFSDCVEFIQSSHLEAHGVVVIMVEDIEVFNIAAD